MEMGTDEVGRRDAVMPVGLGSATFDREYGAIASTNKVWELAAEAFGEEYPVEVQPWGATTWWTLGRLVALARLRPGGLLVDMGCGGGGPGLWLASRATRAHLIGVDSSRVAIHQADARAEHFVGPGAARFLLGDLAETTLATDSADVVVCLDALPYAHDLVGALREANRILYPGGRYLATAPQGDWYGVCTAAGLTVEVVEDARGYADHAADMAAAWSANQQVLVEELGDSVATGLLERAERVGVSAQDAQQVLICARAAA